ncbi:unnamed protein product [Euphydryas editha]|uniref:Integrase catalytic domain-containing protein n=1 Tax=Euphydryas editha TaxID=104508 RepID=A0AAU9VBP0_EUPED|nr:unnamed protein product [Euphydryas editha]
MAANYIVNVPKLRGKENYSEWVFAAENFLILEGMMKCIKPEEDRGTLVAYALLKNGVYKLQLQENMSAAAIISGELWHRRLDHVNSEYLNKMQNEVDGLTLKEKVDITKSTCTICCEGKQARLPFTHVGKRSAGLLNIINTDICGPMECESIGGFKYFILFVDDFTRMTAVYFLKNKNDAFKSFREYKVLVENQTNKKIRIIRSDNGREFCNAEFNRSRCDSCREVIVVEKENTTIAVTEKENVNETSKGTDQPSSVEDDTLTSHEKSTNDSDSEYAPNTGDLTLQEALTRNEKEYWQKALKEEFQWFEENQAWELVDASNSGCVVQCKWVLKKKCDVDGKVLYRARLVAKCFTQRHGVDYNETFSPVVRYSTLRLLFALTVKLDFKTTHLDVKTAFLNGHLEDDDFMQKPDCFVKSCFLKLKKGYLWIKAIFKNVV